VAVRISLTGHLTILLGLIVAAFVLMPFFTEARLAGHVLRPAIEILLVFIVWRLGGHRRLLVGVAGIVVLNEVTEWLLALAPRAGLVVSSEVFTLVFVATTAGFMGWTAWRQESVGVEALIGAVAVYFLLGYLWSGIFSLIEFGTPGSFSGICDPRPDGAVACRPEIAQFPRLVYFSFVTMTTLGYGDVAPLTRAAEGVAMMAAVSGQLFLAMVIGRLVSLYMAKRRES
jgi:voltage-gated potassium channel